MEHRALPKINIPVRVFLSICFFSIAFYSCKAYKAARDVLPGMWIPNIIQAVICHLFALDIYTHVLFSLCSPLPVFYILNYTVCFEQSPPETEPDTQRSRGKYEPCCWQIIIHFTSGNCPFTPPHACLVNVVNPV